MARWLSRIDPRRKKSKKRTNEPQQYEVICRCGERLLGLRISRYQQAICKQCGEPLFVLPANVYPSPPPPKPTSVPAPPADADSEPDSEPDMTALAEAAIDEPLRDADGASHPPSATSPAIAEDDLLGALAEESKSLTRKGKQEELQRKQAEEERARLKEARRAEKKAKANKARQENPLTAREPFKQRLRRVFSPFRMIVCSVIAIIGATVAWQIHSRNLENGRLRFDSARKEAMAFLEERDFVAAEPLFLEAAEAADLIGRTDRQSQQVRRLALETNVVNNLSITSVYEAVDAATTASKDDMCEVLMTQLGDRWIVLDTYVTPLSQTEEGSRYSVDVPLLVNNVFVEATVVTAAFDPLNLQKVGQPVAFAAKVESCTVRQDKEGGDRLVIQLAADSIRVWANEVTYKSLGFNGAELPEHLKTQASSLGVSQ